MRLSGYCRIVKVFVSTISMLIVIAGGSGIRAADSETTKIRYGTIKYFVPSHRIRIEARVTDKEGVDSVRCYFRAYTTEDYVFVPMQAVEQDSYQGIIPSPSPSTHTIQYRFVAVNGKNQIARSPIIIMQQEKTKDVPQWQQVSSDDPIMVFSDEENLAAPPGFADRITKNTAQRAFHEAREGATRGAGQVEGGGSRSASQSKSAVKGKTTTGAGASSKTALWLAGGAAVVGGGVALATGGGGGGDAGTPCDQTVQAGADTPETHRIDLGSSSGTFGFNWEMYGIPDRMVVTYENRTLLDTGCVSGSGFRYLSYSGSSRTVTVSVTPNCDGTTGTSWEFRVDCPQ